MEFTREFLESRDSWDKISAEGEEYVKMAEAEISIQRLKEGAITMKVSVPKGSLHEFFTIASQFVDEHTLNAWKRKAKL
jgi:hypothetical protein